MPRISEPFCRRENAVFRSPWAPDAVAWGRKLRGEFGRIRTPRKRKAGRGSQRTTGFVELASLSMLSDICIQLAGAVGGIECRGRVSSSSHLEMPSCRPADISSTEPDLRTLQANASSPRRRAGPSRFSSSRFGASRGRRPTPDARRPTPDPRQPTPLGPRLPADIQRVLGRRERKRAPVPRGVATRPCLPALESAIVATFHACEPTGCSPHATN